MGIEFCIVLSATYLQEMLNPADTLRNNNAIIKSKRRRFDVMMTL